MCCDDQDELVAVSPGCDGEYLENILVGTGPITVTPNACTLEIGFDPTGVFEDKLVAVDASCTPVYLEDAMISGQGVDIDKNNCQLSANIDQEWSGWSLPFCAIRLSATQEFTVPPTSLQNETVPFDKYECNADYVSMATDNANEITIPED